MNLSLNGKRALVTGSSHGIGEAIARALVAEGCRVMLNGRKQAPLEALAAELGAAAEFCVADVTKAADCAKLAREADARLGGIDILVCNVGSGASVPPGEENTAELQRMLELNFLSATQMVEACAEALAKAKGNVVCVSSICGLEVLGAPVAYGAAKAALNHYVQASARPLGRRGIRINAVAPGNILFEGSTWAKKTAADPAAVQAMLERDVALARLGKPEEVASLCVFLASPRATFITGSIQVIDGGQTRS
jgi:3-oxoacyl-[acyl-carrier protein] reductase